MLRVYLIDGEQSALDSMERLLVDNGNIEVVGKFRNPEEAVMKIGREQIDAVFLNIQLPVMNGFETAKCLMGAVPSVDIVFVAAHSRYAVRAFELHAADYLLRPPHPIRLSKTIERLLENRSRKNRARRLTEQVRANEDESGGRGRQAVDCRTY